MEYLNAGSTITSSYGTVLSATTGTKILVKTIHATNTFSGDTSLYLRWHDNSDSNNSYQLSYGVIVPQISSFQALDGTFVLDTGDYIQASTESDTDAIDLTISYLEITTSEG
tara:strand:+ start:1098 stop:1433 length:336 start_codon:yes stop_codon:yes gene_type:complete